LKPINFARNIRVYDSHVFSHRIEQNEMPEIRHSPLSRCLLVIVLSLWGLTALAQGKVALTDEVPRHPLEIKAITQPDEVLEEIPAALEAARKNHDMRTLALLYLAQANACRVIANWPCQRSAGGSAREAAVLAGDEVLEVRGLIADSRASIAMQDFLRGERLLGEAELLLKKAPLPDLMSDVYLAYSSLSFTLNKFEISANYAQRGLDALPVGRELPTRARLLRNLGRAQAQLAQTEAAQLSLQMARDYAAQLNDPKLSAELHLETARLAHLMQDAKMQTKSANAVLALAEQLKNSQLEGQAHEALGIAATDAKDAATAEQQFRAAFASFNLLKLERDELRVLRLLIKLVTDAQRVPADIASLSARNVALGMKIEQEDRAKAAADFDARLRFITSENELRQLKVEAEASKEREKLLLRNSHLAQLAAALVALVLIVLVGFFLQLRRNKRLQERLARIDVLTGIANRRQFEERLAMALARSKRQQIPLMLLAFDIDKFKSINDTHGHAVGDAVIVEFARRISSCVREGDLPARIGGDEFLVLIEDATQPEVGMVIAEKILERMRQPMQIGALTLPVTSSIGVGFAEHPETSVALLDLADRALYAAKEAGRNTARLLQG
jgi:diguanylate cyclase (GGDEF)-like protein